MPPEPPPWDRRDFVFREKKHDRGALYSDALGTGGSSSSVPRWREPCHAARDFPTPSPRRPPPGYYRHGGGGSGYNSLFPEEPCSRSEDDGFRTYPSGRYGGSSNRTGNNREGGGYFRRSSWDSGDFPRQHHDSIASQRSVGDSISHPSPHLIPFEDQHDKTGGGGLDDGSRAGHKHDRDPDHSLGSLQWKPLKWNRTGSFTSSSKVVRSESEEGRLEVVVPTGKETPVESPVASPLPLDESLPRKKQRLGWGQGLAKYEKEKFEGTDDGGGKNSLVKSSLTDGSPKLMDRPGSVSPATPASMSCSSSHGEEDKHSSKEANNDASTNLNNSPCHDCQLCLENFSINSELSDLSSLNDISSLLADLLHSEDTCTAGSHFMRQTAMNKLLLLKETILKQLEKTESEIDLFENELKKLNSECERSGPCLKSLNLNSECERSDPCQGSLRIPVDHLPRSSEELESVVMRVSSYSTPVLASDVALLLGKRPLGVVGEANRPDGFSPNAVDSECLDSAFREKGAFESNTLKEAVLEAGRSVMSDTDHHQLPSTIGNEPVAIGCGGAPDVRTPCFDASCAANFVQECCSLSASVFALNRDCAKRGSEVLNISFPINSSSFQKVGSSENVADKKELDIRNKLAMHKCFLRFKERALTLKYRAFQHLWKEDLRLLSIRKHRSKSQKRGELNCRSSQNGSQKSRFSLRSRFAVSGNLTLVPTSEILEFTSKLLSDSQIKLYRNNLRMPSLILDEREKSHSRFITNNGLIEDPCSFEKERSMINPWTSEEREIFMEMLAMYGKDFTKIASFLSHKTTADCVEFYYKNHKSESFEKVKKSLGLRKNRQVVPANSYLLTSGKKWKREINAAALDVLGTASMIASQADDNMRAQHRFSGRSTLGSHHDIRMPRGTCAAFEMSSNNDILGQERETSAADVLIGICGALSSEAMSSCVTTSFDPSEKINYVAVDRHLTSEVSQIVDDDTCSDEGCGELDSIDWTDEEKSTFISALSSYGRDFTRVAHCVGTRSKEQCKIFFSKARKCLGLDAILRGTLSDANIGKSDTEDACMFEIDSAICSTQSCSKMEADFTHSTANDSSAASGHAAEIALHFDQDTCGEQHDIGASSQERAETEMEKLTPSSNGNGIVSLEEENPCFDLTEGKDLKVDLGSNLSTQLDESADRHPGIERGEDEIDPAESPGESVSTGKVAPVERMDSCASGEPLLTGADKGLPGDCLRAEFELKKIMVAKIEVDGEQQSETCLQAEDITKSPPFISVTNANDSARLPDDKVNASPQVVYTSSHIQPLDLLPGFDKSQFVSREQKVNSTLPVPLPQPLPAQYEDHSQAGASSQSAFNFEGHGSKQQKILASEDIYQQYLSGTAILRGYPLQVLKKKEMNGQSPAVCERSVMLLSCPKKSGSAQSTELFLQDSRGESGSNSYQSPQLGSGITFLPKDNDHTDAQLRPCLHSGSKDMLEEQSVRTGDVKLFGQILSHPSPVQRPKSPARSSSNHKPSNSSQGSSLDLMNGHADGPLPLVRVERSYHQSRPEMPGRNFGIWGDNSMQRGITVVPESGMFMAKYPGAATLSCYTVKDHPGNCGFVQQAYLQPLTLDGNRSDISMDLQKHNGFETVSGFQHQSRVSLGRVAGSSILVSSKGCTGVSDPVAAFKMHYAAQRTGVLRSEEESWRADIGR